MKIGFSKKMMDDINQLMLLCGENDICTSERKN